MIVRPFIMTIVNSSIITVVIAEVRAVFAHPAQVHADDNNILKTDPKP